MPGLVAFQRRWSVGSDDLVVPGVFLFVMHFIWIVVLLITLITYPEHVPECGILLRQHLIGYLAIFLLSLLLETFITLSALRGSILDTDKRKAVPNLIYLRLVVLLVEVVWLVLGIIWLSCYYSVCSQLTAAKDTLLGIVVCSMMVIVSVVVTLWCTFDPAGRSWVKMMNYQRSMKQSESRFQYRRSGSCTRTWRQRKVLRAYQDSWDHRCRLLFCCMRHSDRSQNSFGDIARLLSDFFRDIDVVPSDVVAGLILLRKYQKVEREATLKRGLNNTYEYLSGVAVTSQTQFLPLHDPAHYNFFQDVIYYMHLAMGAYGWPFYVMNNSVKTVCELCASLRCSCFGGCRRDIPALIIKDNCCMCNQTALEHIMSHHDVELVYATFHVDVGITPFFVAVDHERKKVIISIRGTLSLKDILTDLNAEGEVIPISPPKEDWLGHKGMVQVAVHIRDKLVSEKILERAWQWNAERGTGEYKLVTVGHSLGAGAAAILAILLRDVYPDVICFSYSPPGGTLSLPAAEHSKGFVTSVVVGKDVVPRIGLHQMESLRADLMHAIKRSKDPKWKTISCSIVCCGCAVLPTSAAELKADDAMQNEYQAEKHKARDVFRSQTSNVALTSHQPLFPPGRIIHVVRHHTTKDEHRYESRWRQVVRKHTPVYQALWANNTDFDEVLISPVMIQDHMPDQVLAALEKVITSAGPRKPQRRGVSSPHEDEIVKPPTPVSPPHKIQLETSFTSLASPDTNHNLHKLSLQSFHSHSSNSNSITLRTDSLKKPSSLTDAVSPAAPSGRSLIPWEYQSVLDPPPSRTEMIHDDWLGLAPLATPESLSEVSSISSRASSFVLPKKEASGLRRTLKITNGLAKAGDDAKSNARFRAILNGTDVHDSADNETGSYASARSLIPTPTRDTNGDWYASAKSSSGDSLIQQQQVHQPRWESEDCFASAQSSSGDSLTSKQPITESITITPCTETDTINYHKPTMVLMPDDEKYPRRRQTPSPLPYLETDFSLSDPNLNELKLKPMHLQQGVSFDQDYEFDMETESCRLIDSQNESEISLVASTTCKSLQTQDSCYRDDDSLEDTAKRKVKVHCSQSAEALPLLASLNTTPTDRKRKYSFSILSVAKGESSV